jgi:antitoxin YefM
VEARLAALGMLAALADLRGDLSRQLLLARLSRPCSAEGPRGAAAGRCAAYPAKVAILLAMTVGEQMPLAEVKNRLSEVVDRLEREHGRVVITKHGHPAAVVISVEDLESLEESLDVMGNEALLADIREALAELATADAPVLSKDEALRMISGR